jgi:hypothetical protein
MMSNEVEDLKIESGSLAQRVSDDPGDMVPWLHYKEAGTLAVAERRNITFRSIPTGQLFRALMDGRYMQGTHDYPSAARSIALNLREFCDEELFYPDMIADAARKAADHIKTADEFATGLKDQLAAAQKREREKDLEIDRLHSVLNTPETEDFYAGIELEAAHQRERWGSDHDAGKGHADWFWLIGYLAGKCLNAAIANDREKALHHTISTAAALANWHRAIKGFGNMRPGIKPPVG